MIGFFLDVALFAVKAKLRGDRAAWEFARSLIWESENRLNYYKQAGPLKLPTVDLAQLVGNLELPLCSSALRLEEGGTDPFETACIVAITRFVKPNRIFEFGTFKGHNTVLFAQNSGQSTEVYTLDLPASDVAAMDTKPCDGDLKYVNKTAIGQYIQQEDNNKITQLFGDSMTYDFSRFANQCDLVFVDASHSYPFVKSDTANAVKMLREGGVILWHDYKPPCPGVVRVLHQAAHNHQIYQIKGTSLAVYGLEPA